MNDDLSPQLGSSTSPVNDDEPSLGSTAAVLHALQYLDNDDPEIRNRVAAALATISEHDNAPPSVPANIAGIRDDAIIERLVNALEDASMSIRERAALALGAIGAQLPLERQADIAEQIIAAVDRFEAVRPRRERSFFNYLERLLQYSENLALSLSELRVEVAPILISHLENLGLVQYFDQIYPGPMRRHPLGEALIRFDLPVLAYVEAAFNGANKETRLSLVEVVGEISVPQSIEFLQRGMETDPNYYVRRSAMGGLAGIWKQYPFTEVKILPLFLQALTDEDGWIREASRRLLEGIRNPAPVPPPVVTRLHSEEYYIEQLQSIKTMLQSEDSNLRREAVEELRLLTREGQKVSDIPPEIGTLAANEIVLNSDILLDTAILANFGDLRAVPFLEEHFSLSDPLASLVALGHILIRNKDNPESARIVQYFTNLPSGLKINDKLIVARYLYEANKPQGFELLRELIHSDCSSIIMHDIGEYGDISFLDTLEPFLQHDIQFYREAAFDAILALAKREPSVEARTYDLFTCSMQDARNRVKAILSLGMLGKVEAVEEVSKYLSHTTVAVRAAAAEALGELGSKVTNRNEKTKICETIMPLLHDWSPVVYSWSHRNLPYSRPCKRVCLIARSALLKMGTPDELTGLKEWENSILDAL